jgi:hypothetical protein
MCFFFANPGKSREFIEGVRDVDLLPYPFRGAFYVARAINKVCRGEEVPNRLRRLLPSLVGRGVTVGEQPDEIIRFAAGLAQDALLDDHPPDLGLRGQDPVLAEAAAQSLRHRLGPEEE